MQKSAEQLKARLSAGVTIQHLQPPSLLFGQRLGAVQSHQLYPEPPQVSAAVAPRVTERSQHITAQSGGSGSTQLARCTRRALGHGHRSDTWIFRFMPGTTLFGDGNKKQKNKKHILSACDPHRVLSYRGQSFHHKHGWMNGVARGGIVGGREGKKKKKKEGCVRPGSGEVDL